MKSLVSVLNKFSKREKIILIVTIVISIAIPLTVFLSLKIRDLRPKATTQALVEPQDLVNQLQFKYDAKKNTLTLVSREKTSLLAAQREERKQAKTNGSLRFRIRQLTDKGHPVFTSQKMISPARGKTEVLFSITTFGDRGKLEITLPFNRVTKSFTLQ